jgi:hypothetical protein
VIPKETKTYLDELVKRCRIPVSLQEDSESYMFIYRDNKEVLAFGFENIRGPGFFIEYRNLDSGEKYENRSFRIDFLDGRLFRELGIHK